MARLAVLGLLLAALFGVTFGGEAMAARPRTAHHRSTVVRAGARAGKAAAPTTTFAVPVNTTWTDTGLTVSAGEPIAIEATGTAFLNGSASEAVSPAGIPWGRDAGARGPCPDFSSPSYGDTPAPGLACWSLVGRVGPSGSPFEVGSSSFSVAPASGDLYLGFNDWAPSGTTGGYTAHITLGQAPPVTTASTLGGGSPSLRAGTCASGSRPVDCVTGDLWHTFGEFWLPGPGLPLDQSLTYNSLSADVAGPFGDGWASPDDMSLTIGPGNAVTVNEGNGSSETATYSPSCGWVFPSYVDAVLVHNPDGTYSFFRDDGTTYNFSAGGQLVSESPWQGPVTTFTYSAGQLTTVTDPAGRTLTYTYDPSGEVASVTGPLGRTFTYDYDSQGNLVQITDPAGDTTTFTYDGQHHLLTMTDPVGGVTTNAYDSFGRVVSQSDPMGRTTTYDYASAPGAVSGSTIVTDPNGNQTRYDDSGNVVTAITRASGTSLAARYVYDDSDRTFQVIEAVDPLGDITSATYDNRGHALTTDNAMCAGGTTCTAADPGRPWTYTYNRFGEILTAVDPLGFQTTYTYDARGDVLSRSAGGAVTRYVYGDSSDPRASTAMTDPDGHTWTYAYDSYGNRTSATDPLGNTTTYTYDQLDNRLTEVSPRGNAAGGDRTDFTTTWTYDALDRVVTSTDPLGDETQTTYDGDSNIVEITDPRGNQTKYTFDPDDELTSVTYPDGSTTSYGYDGDGNRITVTDGNGNVTRYSYDALNRQISVEDPLGRTTSYGYDPRGDLVSVTDPSGRVTSNAYDAAGALIETSYSDGSTPTVTYTYDADGRRISMSDGTGTTTYQYDALGRQIATTDGAGDTVRHGYDAVGSATTIVYPNGDTVRRSYDADDRLIAVKDWLGHTTKFTYDPDGNLVGETAGSTPAVTDAYTYDDADRLIGIVVTQSASTLQSFAYTRDADGLVTSVTPGTGSPGNYVYDAVGRLSQDPQGSYAYDAADNATSLPQTTALAYDAADELTSSGPSSALTRYTYDSLGSRISTTPASGPASTMTYDQAERMIGFQSGSTTASYTYDGDGLRMAKDVNGTTSTFVWDTAGPTPRLLGDGTYLYIDGPFGLPVEEVAGPSTVYYLHRDQLGSTTMLTDLTGTNVDVFTYDSLGALQSTTNPAIPQSVLYRGMYGDAESGLYYSGSAVKLEGKLLAMRLQDPNVGLFIAVPDRASEQVPYFVQPSQVAWNSYESYVASELGREWPSPSISAERYARYYDPATGQYLSRFDVLVPGTPFAVLDEPYVFDGQDPINPAFPSGMSSPPGLDVPSPVDPPGVSGLPGLDCVLPPLDAPFPVLRPLEVSQIILRLTAPLDLVVR